MERLQNVISLDCGELGELDVDVQYTIDSDGDVVLYEVECSIPAPDPNRRLELNLTVWPIGHIVRFQCENAIIQAVQALHEGDLEPDVDSKGVKQ